MSIDKDETEHTDNKNMKKPKGKGSPKKVTMQPSVKTFGASNKNKRTEYPKNDKVMITDALSDVRIK